LLQDYFVLKEKGSLSEVSLTYWLALIQPNSILENLRFDSSQKTGNGDCPLFQS